MTNMNEARVSSGAVLALNGEFDLSQRDRLKDAFEALAADDTIVVDVTHTAYIDSTALGSLLRFRGDVVRRGGTFVIAGPSVMVQRLLDITMLDKLFDVRANAADVDGIAGFRRIELISDES
jgi:anti-anti-sigma factor